MSQEAKLLRRCLAVFTGLSVPWAIPPFCYFTTLHFAEPNRMGYSLEPTSGGVARAIIIYVLMGPVPLAIALLGVKRRVWVHRLLTTMSALVAAFSVGYALFAVRVLLTDQVYGNGGAARAVNEMLLSASVVLDVIRLISVVVLLLVLRRPGVRALYGSDTQPRLF